MFSFLQIKRRAQGGGIVRVLFWWTFVISLMHLCLILLYRFRRSGMEHVPRSGAVIFVANHQSNYDPAIVGSLVADRPFCGIARKGLFSSKILSWFLHQFGAIEINRGESDIKAIRLAVKELHVGGCVLLFPEGTRTPDGKMSEFKRGFWLLVKKTNAIIVPIGIDGAYDAWKIGSKPKWRGYIEAIAGSPISAESLIKMGEEDGSEFIRSTIEKLRQGCQENIEKRSK